MIKHSGQWTTEEIADRFEEAIRTLKRLEVPHTKPMGYFSAWPEIVYTTWELESQEQPMLKLGPPTPDQITKMEKTFDWLLLLDKPIDRHVIWMRARRVPWKIVCAYTGYRRTKTWEMWNAALEIISLKLNKNL